MKKPLVDELACISQYISLTDPDYNPLSFVIASIDLIPLGFACNLME